MFAPESATIDDLLDMYRARKTHPLKVKRTTYPRMTWFGPSYWWEIHAGGLEPIAAFPSWRDAVTVAYAIARSHRGPR